jgi:MFS transporter, ACS family, phthalate transporter
LNQATIAGGAAQSHAAAPTGVAVDEAALFRKVTLHLIPFLLIAYVLCYIDRSNVSFAYLRFKADVGLTDASYGLGAGIFYLGYVVFEVPSNMLLERLGARAAILRIMVAWGIVSASTAFVSTPLQFYIVSDRSLTPYRHAPGEATIVST